MTSAHVRRALVFNDTSARMHYGCNAVMETLVNGLHGVGVTPSWLWPVSMDWRRKASALRRVGGDVIVVNGEGTIHHSAERKRARHLLELVDLAAQMNVPSVLVNASVEALTPDDLARLARFDAIFVRETTSRDYLSEHGIAATVAADLSLGAPPGEACPRDRLLVTDSVSRPVTARLRTFADAQGARFETMQHRPAWLKTMARRVRRGLPGHLMGRQQFKRSIDYAPFVTRLQASRAVVSGRFHTVLFCLLTNTPVLAVSSNTSKIEATLRDALGDASRMIAVDDLENGAAARRLAEVDFTQEERDALERFRARAAEQRRHLFETIAALARGETPA